MRPLVSQHITVNTVSSTLTALGMTVPNSAARILLVPAGTINYAINNTANTNTPAVPSAGVDMPIDTGTINQMQFVAASNVAMDVTIYC